MPIYNPVLKNLDIAEIKRYSGLPPSAQFSPHLLDQACTDAYILAKPRVIWQVYDYQASTRTIMSPHPYTLPSTKVSEHLKNVLQVVVIAVTIGSKLEARVEECFSTDEYTLGLLLDAAGTTSVEIAADQACDFIKQQVSGQGYCTLSRFSPGYGQWDISVQPTILALAHGQEINITCTASCMLLPRKSITAIIGLTPNMSDTTIDTSSQCKPCQQCQQIDCLARKD
jgi:hypothetical protein